MLKTLYKYILGFFVSNLLLSLSIFTFILLLDKVFELIDLFLHKGIGVWFILKLLFFLLPSLLSLTLPVACLLATLLTYGQLSETSEVTAMRASGIHPWSYMAPPFYFACLLVCFLIPFNTYWSPLAHQSFRRSYVEIMQRSPLLRIEEKTFVSIQDYNLYVEKKMKRSPQLRGVTIYKTPQEGAPLRIFAESGDVSLNPARGMLLKLNRGRIGEIRADRPNRWFYTTFESYSLFIPFNIERQMESKIIQEMTNRELKKEVKQLELAGKKSTFQRSEIALRYALALTPLLLVLLGAPIASRFHRGARGVGLLLGILIIAVYYALTMASLTLGQRQILPAGPAAWLSNLTLMGLIFFFHRRFLRE